MDDAPVSYWIREMDGWMGTYKFMHIMNVLIGTGAASIVLDKRDGWMDG
jgi:hypothetical protein